MIKQWALRLAKELFALSNGQGKAIKNQTSLHKQAYANRFNTYKLLDFNSIF